MTTIARLLALVVLAGVTVACGGSTPAAAPVTVAADVSSSIAPTTVPAPTTTVAPLSREGRLAVGRCRDALPASFAVAVATETIGKRVSPTLAAAQDVCNEAESQLEADNAPAVSATGRLLAAVVKVNLALGKAESQVRGVRLIDPVTCPNDAACPIRVLESAAGGLRVTVGSVFAQT